MTGYQSISEDLKRIRVEAPLVHNITNYVVMNWTANCLLAIGASPIMAHAIEEVQDMLGLARSLVVNIGTLSTSWILSMEAAMKAAQDRRIPIILDPVGVGATQFRTDTVKHLIERNPPAIIRGNASEIISLGKDILATKGVDSTQKSETALEAARHLSFTYKCVVCISGEIDYVVDGHTQCRIVNGHSVMSRVTGMGCAATAVIGAFAAIQPSSFLATVHAMSIMSIAGEIAAVQSQGPGSFQPQFLDLLNQIDESRLKSRLRLEVV